MVIGVCVPKGHNGLLHAFLASNSFLNIEIQLCVISEPQRKLMLKDFPLPNTVVKGMNGADGYSERC